MRRISVAMLLFSLALTILLGREAVSEPFASTGQPDRCAAAALVSLGDNVFLAWPAKREGEPGLFITLIDRQLSELPGRRIFLPEEQHVGCVAAATNGHDVALVWAAPAEILNMARFSPDLELLDGPLVVHGMPADARPGIAWQMGAQSYLVVAGSWFERHPIGLAQVASGTVPDWKINATHGPFPGGSRVFDAVAVNGTTSILSARAYVPQQPCYIPFRATCPPFPDASSIGVARPHPAAILEVDSMNGDGLSLTTVGCVLDDCLVAWLRLSEDYTGVGHQIFAKWLNQPGLIRVIETLTPNVTGLTTGSDGTQLLLAWEEGSAARRRIMGSIIHASGASAPFVIAEGTTARRKPAIAVMGEGQFLVAYEIADDQLPPYFGGTELRLAGRVVHVDPPHRRRAVR